MKSCASIVVSVFHVLSAGTEEIQIIPGNQTTLDLRDLTVGVSHGVSVVALVGENEGEPVTVFIKPGELCRGTCCCQISLIFVDSWWRSICFFLLPSTK